MFKKIILILLGVSSSLSITADPKNPFTDLRVTKADFVPVLKPQVSNDIGKTSVSIGIAAVFFGKPDIVVACALSWMSGLHSAYNYDKKNKTGSYVREYVKGSVHGALLSVAPIITRDLVVGIVTKNIDDRNCINETTKNGIRHEIALKIVEMNQDRYREQITKSSDVNNKDIKDKFVTDCTYIANRVFAVIEKENANHYRQAIFDSAEKAATAAVGATMVVVALDLIPSSINAIINSREFFNKTKE